MRMTLVLMAVLLAACSDAPTGPVAEETVPPARGDTLLSTGRVAGMPKADRPGWELYLDASRRNRERDRAALDAEVRAAGMQTWTPAPVGPDFALTGAMTEAWFRTAEARRIADVIVSFQTPTGGWSKAVDMTGRPRQPGESYGSGTTWNAIGTIDNGTTSEQLRFLAAAVRAHGDARHRDAFLKGLDYLHAAQFPSGCWPQIYPLQGGYHDAATYNDDAMVRVLRVLRSVARGEHAFIPEAQRARADAAVDRGVACILATQVAVAGKKTVWGQQHDPLTGAPVKARAFEPAALSGRESAGILDFLMEVESPSATVVGAVHDAAAWLRSVAVMGYDYDSTRGELVARPGAGPIWARLYEIGTNRPVFGDRDGSVRYVLAEISEERRRGYAWYSTVPAATLRRYDTWARQYPKP